MTVPVSDKSIFEIIKSRTGELTKSEKKVARSILSDYPAAGLLTVAELAKSSNVSGQTVIRFVASLGFESFPAFHGQLIEELKARNAPPATRHEEHRLVQGQDNALSQCHQKLSGNLTETFSRLPEAEFTDAVSMLCDSKRPLIATGGRASGLLAQYCIIQLQQMRPKTSFIPSDRASRAHAILDLNNHSTVVIYDFRRYSAATLKFAEAAHEKGAHILLITDPFLSPASKYARVVLPVQVDFLTPFDSQLCGIAVTETLIAAATQELAQGITARMKAYEQHRENL